MPKQSKPLPTSKLQQEVTKKMHGGKGKKHMVFRLKQQCKTLGRRRFEAFKNVGALIVATGALKGHSSCHNNLRSAWCMYLTKGTFKEKAAMIGTEIMPTWCAAEAAGHTLGSFKHNLITSQEESELKYLQKKRKMQESLAGRRRSN